MKLARAGFVSLLKAEIEAQNKVYKDGETKMQKELETKSAATDSIELQPETEWEVEGELRASDRCSRTYLIKLSHILLKFKIYKNN